MYDIVSQIIDHSWTTNSSEQQYVYMISGVLIVIVAVTAIDLIYRIFSHFWRE